MEKYYEGKFIGSGKGFGFIAIDGIEDDFFIPPNKTLGALDGDRVVIEPISVGEVSNIAEVKKILEYANQTLVGNLMYGLMGNYVVADNIRIHKTVLIKPQDLNGGNVGDKVVVKITTQPLSSEDLRGEIIEVLGKATERSVLEKAIIRTNKIRDVFPQEVIDKAESFGQEVLEKDKINRQNLTKAEIFTIDGDDSKDLDDAIQVKKLDNGNYLLGVHIADVGQYVKKGGVIDLEAYERGTSTYFPGYVIPMLPTSLSNGICSLNEGVERLTLSCEMEINKEGTVVNHNIFESIIKSCGRLTYDKVLATMQGKKTEEKYQKLLPTFKLMEELTHILQNKKDREGYLDFDLPETYFELNERGELLNVLKADRHIVHQIIEAFMVVANETVAEHFYKLKIPFVYRVHEVPSPEKAKQLADFMEGLGLTPIKLDSHISPKNYQLILKNIDGEPYEQVLNKVILMSMQKARYCEKCLGHFGLASPYYCHFTSPIRRYPDLTIHRIIKDYLHKDVDENDKNLKLFVEEASENSSIKEKNAEVSERQVSALKMAEFMQKHIGEEFDGTICGVTAFGVFVELENTIEGMIRIENLPTDEYEYIDKTFTLKGRNHKFGYGDYIKIRVAGVNLAKRQVDFCESTMPFTPKVVKDDKYCKPKLNRERLEKSNIKNDNSKQTKGKISGGINKKFKKKPIKSRKFGKIYGRK